MYLLLYLIHFSIRSKFHCFWLFLPQHLIYVQFTPSVQQFLSLTYFSRTSYLSSRFCNNKFCYFSVVGLNFDFLCYNILGYLAYSVYNVGLFYFKSIQVYFPIIPDNWHLLIPLKTSENLAYQVVRNVRFDRLIFLGRSWREYWEKRVNRPS